MKINKFFEFEISKEINSNLKMDTGDKYWTNLEKSTIKEKLLVFYKIAEIKCLENRLLPKLSRINDTLLSKSSDVFYFNSDSDKVKLKERIKKSTLLSNFERKITNKFDKDKKSELKDFINNVSLEIISELKDIYKSYFFNLLFIESITRINQQNIDKNQYRSFLDENFELSNHYYACDIYSKTLENNHESSRIWNEKVKSYFVKFENKQVILSLLIHSLINDVFINYDFNLLINEKYNDLINFILNVLNSILSSNLNIDQHIEILDLGNEMNHVKSQCALIQDNLLTSEFVTSSNFITFIKFNNVESCISLNFSNNEEFNVEKILKEELI